MSAREARLFMRKQGISTLIGCQNEEATVGWSIVSFLEFSDEIIVVDNGSTDASKDVCREMERRYPDKVRFYDAPDLKDLYENRECALQRSRYRWIVRADADFVCYTDGDYDCGMLRKELLSGTLSRGWRPLVVRVRQPSLHGDFWHTVSPEHDGKEEGWEMTWRRLDRPMARVFRWFPGMRFARKGRLEGVVYGPLGNRLLTHVDWPAPVWMHCNVKSSENYLFRSERTNWRECGNYERYPSLEAYLRDVVPRKYGTDDLDVAKKLYVERQVLPRLTPYDETQLYPYPALVRRAMETSPVYRIIREKDRLVRRYLGPPDVASAIVRDVRT